MSLNPQPLPPVETGIWPSDRVQSSGLRDVRTIAWVPGFAGRPIAVAELSDGSHLLLNLTGSETRVAGIFAGPFGSLDTAQHFAIASEKKRVTVFRRVEAPLTAPILAASPAKLTPGPESHPASIA